MALKKINILLLIDGNVNNSRNITEAGDTTFANIHKDVGWIEEILRQVKLPQFQWISVRELPEAISTLETVTIDVLIVDLSITSNGNLEIISQLHSLAPKQAIVVIGNREDETAFQEALRRGAQEYLVKNEITPQQLQRRLLCALERQQHQVNSNFQRIKTSKANPYQWELKQNEVQFRAIFERSSIGIGLVDMKARIVDSNPALCQMLGYSQEELSGKRFTDVIVKQKKDSQLYKQILSGNCNHLEMERRFLHKNGKLLWTHLNISLIPAINGKPEFFLAMIEDISVRKQTELKLRASKEAAEAGSRAKSEFLATMSHELRTPLNAIMGLSQLLQQEIVGNLNDKQKEYVNCIYGSGEHLLELINDILDLSKVEAGKEELLLSKLQVKDLCNYVISTVSDRAERKGLQLTTEIDPQADICIADERRMKQMLLNLLTNAIKFTQAGKVSLEVKKISTGLTFTVSDTGIGIDPEQLKLLFQPFQQLDSRLNRQYEGTGLGLALTRKLARLHGGDITVKSVLGEGSEFTLFLSDELNEELGETSFEENSNSQKNFQTIQSPQPDYISQITNPESSFGEAFEEEPTHHSLSRTKRIILLENEQQTANRLQDYLQTIGYQVESIVDGEDFLEQLSKEQPDLILLDGEFKKDVCISDLLIKMRQQPNLQDVPIVMMTPPQGKGMTNNELVNLYLKKPIGIVQMESMIMQYLS
ncbi:MAG: ATP-binding protein [Nostocaceae cyanobacterium]|nr:ATP-binding protein [Nostocaceae cyanobacterium]